MTTLPAPGHIVEGPPDLGELTLGQYLGAGAFGIVFTATSAATSDQVAVKFLQPGLVVDATERQALFNELMAAKELRHPNVLAVLHANTQPPGLPPYLVMELADGGTLQAKLDDARRAQRQLPLAVLSDWSATLAKAMSAINERVLHRDLKPDNILFRSEVLKVSDFGLAKLVGAATRTLTFKGGQHVLYMAPEAWGGGRNTIQLDMYAFGIVLYQMATLGYPYPSPSDPTDLDAFRRMHLTSQPTDAARVRTDLPLRFAATISRLLSKRPEDRYASWTEVVAALEASFKAAPAAVAPIGDVAALVRTATRRHQQAVADQLEKEAEVRRQKEEAEIDELQHRDIIARVTKIVDAFNDSTEGPRASLSGNLAHGYRLTLPYAMPATIQFFWPRQPLTIRSHTVRFAALVADPAGCGFNLLLRRQKGEQYGEWVVCRVRALGSHGPAHCTEFGLPERDVEHIERGIRAFHIYSPDIRPDVDAALEAFVKSLYDAH